MTKQLNIDLPALPYGENALDPFVTAETFEYHHGKHHATYVNNLRNLVRDTPLEELDVASIVRRSFDEGNTPVFNNSAQHWNHSFFWNCLSPDGGGTPGGEVGALIERDFGDFDAFKTAFSDAAVKLFGAGWAWLAQDADGMLEILPLKDAHTPLTSGKTPLLTLDVWEHAYYIDYRNARPRFVEGFWDVVNWDFANENLQ